MLNKLLDNFHTKNKIVISLVIFILLGTTIHSYLSYYNYKKVLMCSIDKTLDNSAFMANNILDNSFFDKAIESDAISKELDLKNIEKLSKIADLLEVEYIYTMVLKDDTIYFTSSSATEDDFKNNQVTYYFDSYPEATKELLNIFKNNEKMYEVSEDKWGRFRTVFIPYRTPNGVKYIVGADIKVSKIDDILLSYLYQVMFLHSFMIIGLIILIVYFRKVSYKEMKEIHTFETELSEEIDSKTLELRELNSSLELRIKEEIEKSNKNQEYMLQQSRLAQMGEMISMIAHQWRQPLNAITAATGVIVLKAKANDLDTDTSVEVAQKIKEFSLHLSKTIDDFRNFFRTNKECLKTNYEVIVKDTISIVDASLKQKQIELVVEFKEVVEFYSYENEIKQVVLNIIKNSEDIFIENSIKNGRIMVCVDKEILTISDNGGGIREEIIDKIFDPYFSTKSTKNGTGLGLYMSKIIIEEHCGGKLEVENIDNGVKFKIILGGKEDE